MTLRPRAPHERQFYDDEHSDPSIGGVAPSVFVGGSPCQTFSAGLEASRAIEAAQRDAAVRYDAWVRGHR